MEKKCVIEKVYTRLEDAIVPTLLSFQNGDLTVTDEDVVQYCTMDNEKTRSKEALVVVDSQAYTGPINAKDDLTDSYICVRNKATNKVRIVPIDQANLKNYIYTELHANDLKAAQRPLDKEANKKYLAKEFGSRKSAMYGSKMQVSVDIVKDDLETTVQETSINAEDLAAKLPASNLENICPKCNKDAETIAEVYNLEDLVPISLLERLDDEAKAVFEADVKTLPIKSTHLLTRVESLKADKSLMRSDVLHKMKIIIFMDCLFNFIKSKQRRVRDIELSGITEKVEVYMRREFLDQPNKSSALSDKALCYYIVLCLLNDPKHSVNISMLAEELGRSTSSIVTYARLVNAMPKSGQSDIVSLRLPKQVPALKRFTNRKGNKM